jgi:lamin tail-like protein
MADGIQLAVPLRVNRSRALWLACAALLSACDNPQVGPDAAPDAPGPHPQGSEARGDLVVNELAPRVSDGPDWIELYNRGSAPIDLCGWFLTDQSDRLDHYLPLGGVLPPAPCAPRLLAAGTYLVIEADGTAIRDGVPIDPLHAPFHLDIADELHLIQTDGLGGDGILYLLPPAAPPGSTLARIPDGSGLFYPVPPSRGDANPATAEVSP